MNAGGWLPGRDIELIAGTPSGGGQDRPARALIRVLEDSGRVPQRITLTNIPGRGGGNGWDALRNRKGDPHVLAVNSPTLITNRHLGVADYDHAALTPLANLYTEYIAFVTRPDSTLRSGADFMARLARDPAGCTIALATALGNTNHMALAQVARHAGADPRALAIRVFDSAPYAVADVMEGRAEIAAITAVSAAGELAQGHVHAFAVSAPRRLPRHYLAVPTLTQQGVDCVVGTWRGVIGAPGLAPEHIAYWENTLRAVTATEEWKTELDTQYWADTFLSGPGLRDFLDRERALLGDTLRDLGLS